ncbi:putative 6-phosphofructo-2-kinase, Fructose-2,6-bisphosphate 2-phosphatase [Helianthus annuus]|nr:putative 6-phosphofructo-2-kinase, Fructose-2,6-bisphosphate 2-phosphatase [Helianthus annuus]
MSIFRGHWTLFTGLKPREVIICSDHLGGWFHQAPTFFMLHIQWHALDEINAGVCDGMTYEEIKKNMPDASEKINLGFDSLVESHLMMLEPFLTELERQSAPVVVVSYQAILKALHAYFADRPSKEVPHTEVTNILDQSFQFCNLRKHH